MGVWKLGMFKVRRQERGKERKSIKVAMEVVGEQWIDGWVGRMDGWIDRQKYMESCSNCAGFFSTVPTLPIP